MRLYLAGVFGKASALTKEEARECLVNKNIL